MAEKWSAFTPAENPIGAERVPWLQDQGAGEDNVLGTWTQVESMIGASFGLGGLAVEIQTSAVVGNIRIRWAETYPSVVFYEAVLIINDLEVVWPSTSVDPWIELPQQILASPEVNRLGVRVTATTGAGARPPETGFATLNPVDPFVDVDEDFTITLAETLITNPERIAAGFNADDVFPDGAVGIANVEGAVLGFASYGARWVIDENASPWMTSPSVSNIPGGEDYAAGGPVWYDDTNNRLLMIWHGEDHTLGEDAFWSFLGMATSADAGVTWTNMGRIITPHLPAGDPLQTIGNIEVGSGPFIIGDDGYMYVYFRDAIDEGASYRVTSLGVARCLLTSVVTAMGAGTAPTFTKLYNGAYGQAGIGGLSTDLIPDETGDIAFDICYLEDASLYVRVGVHGFSEGFAASVRTSPDLVNWSGRKYLWKTMGAERIYVTLSNPSTAVGQQQRKFAGDDIQIYRTRSERTVPHRWDYAELERLTATYAYVAPLSTKVEAQVIPVPESRNLLLSDQGAILVLDGPPIIGPTGDITITIPSATQWPVGFKVSVFDRLMIPAPFETFDGIVAAGGATTLSPAGPVLVPFMGRIDLEHIGADVWLVDTNNSWANSGTKLSTALNMSAAGGNINLLDLGNFGGGITFTLGGPILASPQTTGGAVTRPDLNQVRASGGVKATGVITQTVPRWAASANLAALTSGIVRVVAVDMLKGDLVSSILWHSRSTPGAVMTNQWSAFLDANRVVRAVSADATSAAWLASSSKTFNMITPYAVPSNGVYYLALLVAASTTPTLLGVANTASSPNLIVPLEVGISSTAQTVPPALDTTLAAFTATTVGLPYASVS